MTAISRLSISSRIGLLCLIPLIGLLYFGVSRLVHDLHKVQEENRIAGIIENAPVISALVHQLQKERGTSAGFIGAQGAQFRDDLRARQAETDEALEAFRTALPQASGVLAEPTFAEPFKRANDYLDDLAEKRALVGGMGLSVGEMAKYYTGTIVELLNMIEAVSLMTEDAHLVRDGLAYIAILQGKEAAGIERAMGANGFGAGKFAPEIHRRFVGLAAEQKVYFHLFERFSPGDGVAELRAVLAGEAAEKLRALRELAYGEPFGADISGVTGPQWFAVATAYIDALKTVEDVMAHDIVEDAHELAAKYERDFWILSASLGIIVLLILGLSVVIARSIAQPVRRLSDVMNRLAGGDTEVKVIDHGLRDEIGEMARAVEVFRDNAIARKALEVEAEQAALHEAERKKETMVKLADDFESVVGGIIVAVSENTRELREASQSMSAMAEETSNQSTAVASASEQMAGNVQTVASATEEMGSSVDEIGRQAQNSSDKAGLAADAAQESVVRVQALSGSVQKIGDIVGLIQAIAEQTNLLALNATIEAARAGEAGRGFAVVAAEVKDLATQTSKATEEISSQIAEIQSETESSVAAIETVTQVIEELNGLATSIAAAVDQQGAATREIAGNIQQAAHGSDQVAENIAGVGHAASQSSAAAVRVLELSNTVAEHTDEMRDKTHGFLERVRAG